MLGQLQAGLEEWWFSMTPEFAFLLALPFGVAALGLLGDWLRKRKSEPRAERSRRHDGRWHSGATPGARRR